MVDFGQFLELFFHEKSETGRSAKINSRQIFYFLLSAKILFLNLPIKKLRDYLFPTYKRISRCYPTRLLKLREIYFRISRTMKSLQNVLPTFLDQNFIRNLKIIEKRQL